MFKVLKRIFTKSNAVVSEVPQDTPERVQTRVRFVRDGYRPVDFNGNSIETRTARQLARNKQYDEEIAYCFHGEIVKTQIHWENVIQLTWDLRQPVMFVIHRSVLTVEEQFIVNCLQKCPYFMGYALRSGVTYTKFETNKKKAS